MLFSGTQQATLPRRGRLRCQFGSSSVTKKGQLDDLAEKHGKNVLTRALNAWERFGIGLVERKKENGQQKKY
jgi:hypothetical protein